jgi:prevent-host-death family protein
MTKFVSIYDAKTQLSRLVDEAASGEEIVISKNGVPHARLVPAGRIGKPRKPANLMEITHIAADFDDTDDDMIRLFEGGE